MYTAEQVLGYIKELGNVYYCAELSKDDLGAIFGLDAAENDRLYSMLHS